jgi:hypothetical protein
MRRAAAVSSWWFDPLPLARVAVFRLLVYVFIFIDVLFTTAWVQRHAYVPQEFYRPLFFGRLLDLPVPGPGLVTGVMILLLISAAVALTGWRPRLVGTVVFFLYLEWMFIAMSYGKVDHDRVAFLVALAVLPTVGRARVGEDGDAEAAGWALRMVQVAVVCTYFLAAFAKLRFGGPEWVNGATLLRAVLRRGNFWTDPLLTDNPWILHATQWMIMVFELGSPILLMRNKLGRSLVIFSLGFHMVTYAAISIIFLPHVVSLLSFLPLERVRDVRRRLAPGGGERKIQSQTDAAGVSVQ